MLGGTQHIIQGMVGSQLLQRTITKTIQTTVATIHPIVLVVVENNAHQRRTHLSHLWVDVPLRSNNLVHGLQPVVHHLYQFTRSQATRQVIDVELQVTQNVRTCDFASVVSSHTVGQGNDETVHVLSHKLSSVYITTNQFVVGENHILIICSHTANPTGGCQFDNTHINIS